MLIAMLAIGFVLWKRRPSEQPEIATALDPETIKQIDHSGQPRLRGGVGINRQEFQHAHLHSGDEWRRIVSWVFLRSARSLTVSWR